MQYPALTCRDDLLKMLEELVMHRGKILSECEKLSIEQLNDPVYPGTWNLLKNLAHIATAQQIMMRYIYARPNGPDREQFPKEPVHDLIAIRTALDEAMAETIAFLKANPASVMTEACVFGPKLRPETVGGILFHIVEHEIAHRAFVLNKLKVLQQPKG